MSQDVHPAEAQMPGVPHDVAEGDGAGPALQGEHPVSGPGIVGDVALAPEPDIEAIKRVVQNRQPDPEELEVENKRKAGQQFDLLGVSARAAGGECVGDKVLNQKGAYGNNAAQRMELAEQERMALAGAQGRNAFVGVDRSCWTGGCRHWTPCAVRDDWRTFYYLGASEESQEHQLFFSVSV